MNTCLFVGLSSIVLTTVPEALNTGGVQLRPLASVESGVSVATTSGRRQVLASDGNVTVLAWLGGGDREVYVSRSDGTGLSWSGARRLDAESDLSRLLGEGGVAVSGRTVHVAWEDRRSGVPQAYLSSSRDGGETFEPERLLDFGARSGLQSSSGADSFELAVEGKQLHVLASAQDRLLLLSSGDRGKTFGPPHVVVDSRVAGSDLVVEAGRVLVAWREEGSFVDPAATWLARSLDGGASFEPPVEVSDSQSQGGFASLALAADGDDVAAVWFERGGIFTQTRVNTSADGGATWRSSPARAGGDDYPPFIGLQPQICVRGTEVALALPVLDVPNADPVTGLTDAFGAFLSSPDGIAFSSETLLGLYQTDFQMVGNASELAIVHLSPAFEKSVSYSADGGQSFERTGVLPQPSLTYTSFAFNPLYRNYIGAVYDVFAGELSATGFRPQTLRFDSSVPSVVSAELSRFEGSPFAWVLFSTGTNGEAIPAIDRALGLSIADGLFEHTVELARSGDLSAALDTDGNGSIADVAGFLPAGIPLFAVAGGVDPSALRVRNITDVVRINL